VDLPGEHGAVEALPDELTPMPGTGEACQDAAASAGTFPELLASRRLVDPGGASSDVTVIEVPETNAVAP
jgi:hypothetical protein